MGKVTIDTSIWVENSFDLRTGLVYFFLISNCVKNNKIGCFSIHKKIISFYTDLPIEEVDEAFKELKDKHLIDYDGTEVLITNASNYWTSSPQFIKSLYNEAQEVKSIFLKDKILSEISNLEYQNVKLDKTRKLVYEKYNKKCAYCGENLEYKKFHIDHIKPRKSGGANDLTNYNPSCSKCNLQKANRTLEEYRFFLDKTMQHTFFFEEI